MQPWAELEPQLLRLVGFLEKGDREGAVLVLKGLVPEFEPAANTAQTADVRALQSRVLKEVASGS